MKEEGESAWGRRSVPAQFTSADGEGKDLYACHNNDAVFAKLLSNPRSASLLLRKCPSTRDGYQKTYQTWSSISCRFFPSQERTIWQKRYIPNSSARQTVPRLAPGLACMLPLWSLPRRSSMSLHEPIVRISLPRNNTFHECEVYHCHVRIFCPLREVHSKKGCAVVDFGKNMKWSCSEQK